MILLDKERWYYQTITHLCGNDVKDCSLVLNVWPSMSDRIILVIKQLNAQILRL